MPEQLSVDDRMRAARLLGDIHRFLVLADLKAELARSATVDAKSLLAVADEMNAVVIRLVEAQESIAGIIAQLGEDGMRSRLFDPMNRADSTGLARAEAVARSEGSLVAVFERRAALLPDLASRVAVLAEAPLQSDDACLLALLALGLSTPGGPLATAAAAAQVAHACG